MYARVPRCAAIAEAFANVRLDNGAASPHGIRLLLAILRYNDNTAGRWSDATLVASAVQALGDAFAFVRRSKAAAAAAAAAGSAEAVATLDPAQRGLCGTPMQA